MVVAFHCFCAVCQTAVDAVSMFLLHLTEFLFEVSDWLGEEFEDGSTDEVVTLVQIEEFITKKPEVNRVRVELPTEQLVQAVSMRFPTSAYDKEVDTRAMYP